MRQPSIPRFFVNLSIGTAILFLIVSIFLLQIPKSSQGLKMLEGLSFQLSSEKLLGFFEKEIPFFSMEDVQASNNNIEETTQETSFLTAVFAGTDPKEWVKEELPSFYDFEQLSASNNTDIGTGLMESSTPVELVQENIEDKPTPQPAAAVVKKDAVFIYHTHNRESFIPETKKTYGKELVYDKSLNITLVGKKIGEELEKLGIGSVVSTKDYYPELEEYYFAYKHSLKTVQTALQGNNNYQFIFDIHRDAPPRKDKSTTTIKINGKDYALISFVIGTNNKNYKKNEELAKKLHETLNKLYPGISKGIITKGKDTGNGEYNQSLSPNSVVVEIGGHYNNLEDEYRSAKAIADAVAEIYWQAVKVDANVTPNQQ